ncbi:hypothetical protein pRALTA_0570 (plasmid) [Cupriavidus taiwanensis LMG 19424]|uniref:Uncharacterized protein n=2 Tax=Burkholderiaceae TaxID=119060 RepID=B2AJE3_CUPTR|nr:hypothetical protein pRALTA_0570 [Cupriavidus taiwanensis LMG 19424]
MHIPIEMFLILEMFLKKLNALVRMIIDGNIMEHVLLGVVVIVLAVTLVVPMCKPRGARGSCFRLPGVPPTQPHYTLVLCRKSFTVNDIAGGVVNSFGMSFTLAIWAAHAARGDELGSGGIQGH